MDRANIWVTYASFLMDKYSVFKMIPLPVLSLGTVSSPRAPLPFHIVRGVGLF